MLHSPRSLPAAVSGSGASARPRASRPGDRWPAVRSGKNVPAPIRRCGGRGAPQSRPEARRPRRSHPVQGPHRRQLTGLQQSIELPEIRVDQREGPPRVPSRRAHALQQSGVVEVQLDQGIALLDDGAIAQRDRWAAMWPETVPKKSVRLHPAQLPVPCQQAIPEEPDAKDADRPTVACLAQADQPLEWTESYCADYTTGSARRSPGSSGFVR